MNLIGICKWGPLDVIFIAFVITLLLGWIPLNFLGVKDIVLVPTVILYLVSFWNDILSAIVDNKLEEVIHFDLNVNFKAILVSVKHAWNPLNPGRVFSELSKNLYQLVLFDSLVSFQIDSCVEVSSLPHHFCFFQMLEAYDRLRNYKRGS